MLLSSSLYSIVTERSKMFNSDNSRTALLKKNIAGSFLVKGWSCIVQFLLVPITLLCLNQYEYGIWLTVNSILLWIDQFDIGLGNGLRNKLAESLAHDNRLRARRLVSTTFLTLFVIILPIVAVCAIAISLSDCNSILNVDATVIPNLKGILLVSVAIVGATFVFKFIGNIYMGLQLTAISNLIVVLGQTVALIGIMALAFLDCHSLMAVAIVYTISPLIVYLITYPITFSRYDYLRPSVHMFDKEELSGIFSLGIKFFVVQIAGLVIYASSNVLISKILSPSEVAPYQISYRYFSLAITIFAIIAAPLWSATTDAYAKGDWAWINNVMVRMRKIMIAFLLLLIVMALMSSWIYSVWIGDSVSIPNSLSWMMVAYVAVLIYSTCYSNILFGIGKIRVITIATVAEAIIYIPLAIIMGRSYGLMGIVGTLILVNMICAVCNRIQYYKLSSGKAIGLWNK